MYYNPNYIEWGQQGWTCPKCGRVYSPSTPMCFYCNNQKTWTSPTTNPIGWDDYLKQTTGRPNGWWDDYCRQTTADSVVNKNTTAWNSNNETTCSQSCDTCDKYEKSCFDGIETTSTKAIISHKKPLDINLEWYDSLNSFIKHFQD